jgi:hypothetical protein
MKKYLIAIVVAFGALFGSCVQAAPLPDSTAAIQSQVAQQDATQKVYYRYGWRRGYGWRGYGWRRYGWRPYGFYGRCRLRCNPWRCWRVCW